MAVRRDVYDTCSCTYNAKCANNITTKLMHFCMTWTPTNTSGTRSAHGRSVPNDILFPVAARYGTLMPKCSVSRHRAANTGVPVAPAKAVCDFIHPLGSVYPTR